MKKIQQRSLLTKEKILITAEEMLMSAPYTELTIPLLAQKANISVGGIYNHFESRDVLLEMIHNRYRQRRNDQLNNLIKTKHPNSELKDRIFRLSEVFVNLHQREAGILRSFFIHSWLSSNEKVREEVIDEVDVHKKTIVDYLINEQPELQSISTDLERISYYLIAVSKDVFVLNESTMNSKNIDPEQILNDIYRMVMSLIDQYT